VAAMELEGLFWQGGSYKAPIRVSVIPSSGRFAPVVRPNPFNPPWSRTRPRSRGASAPSFST
jgi:hypothetical protein